MSARIELADKMLEKAEGMLEGIPGASKKAVARALNRALSSGRTAGVREARKVYTAKAGDIRADFGGIKKASSSDLTAGLIGRGSNLSLTKYLYKPKTDTTGARRAPVYAAVRKGGAKPLGDRAFIWDSHAFIRVGATRLPIKKLYGPAVPGLLNNEQVVDAVMDTLEETAERRLDHEILRILEGAE